MKVFLLVTVMLFCFTRLTAQPHSFRDLAGHWFTEEGEGIIIEDSSRIFLVYDNERKRVVSFTADFSKTPAWFDFVVSDGNTRIEVKSLIQVIDRNRLRWQIFEDGIRPGGFDLDRGNLMDLRRK